MMEMPALFEHDSREAADAPLVLLDLPDAEMLTLIRALSPDRVTYGMMSAAKRIAGNIQRAVSDPPTGFPLSERERNAAIRIAYRYRRQMPNSVIALLSRWPATILKEQSK
jgi:hypothetical protein